MTGKTDMAPPPQDEACERCGSFGSLEIGGRLLCADCIAQAGCGCAGHGDPTAE